MTPALPIASSDAERRAHYEGVESQIDALLAGEVDAIAAMATIVCELHHAFAYFDWTGFYRTVRPGVLAVGPYQGAHGCLEIAFTRGVCGAAARTKITQVVDDVNRVDDHIACSATTRSEIVVPVFGHDGEVVAVLDVDSNDLAAFRDCDRAALERICVKHAAKLSPG